MTWVWIQHKAQRPGVTQRQGLSLQCVKALLVSLSPSDVVATILSQHQHTMGWSLNLNFFRALPRNCQLCEVYR